MAKKRGRKPEATTPISEMVLPKIEEMGITISQLEIEMGTTKDAIRNILRGKTGRNRRSKLELLIRVASRIGVLPAVLIDAANMPMPGGKSWDLGTTESQVKRIMLAGGGNPDLCGTPLGVLAARGEVFGIWGISRSLYMAGARFSDFFYSFSRMAGAPKSPESMLASLMDDTKEKNLSDAFVCDAEREERDEIRNRIFRESANRLKRSDAIALKLGYRPSSEVMRVAVNSEMPFYVNTATETQRACDQFTALVIGLNQLRSYYASEEFVRLYRRTKVD